MVCLRTIGARCFDSATGLESRRKHLLKSAENLRERCRGEVAEMTNETFTVHGAQLVDHDLASSAGKATRYAKGILPAARGERGDDDGQEMGIELIGRHDDTRSCFPNLAPAGWIERDEKYISTVG